MKRSILFIAALLISLAAYAEEHMTFKGIEIDGRPIDMVKELQKVGFVYNDLVDNDGIHYMKGKFAGYNATIGIMPNHEGVVHSVGASYTEDLHNWPLLIERFNILETNLTKKYGPPAFMNKDIGNATDGTGALRKNRGQWSSTWLTEKGKIYLYIFVTQLYEQGVFIIYTDKVNKMVDEQQAYDDL